ncbi:hypothetical protein AB0D42_01735 [Streptomyces sp. NPDC048304]|uniref:hypothetical protein n=1 Tax=Streptomyces sp. NPDC048304 TaxID=3154820 RepID=UPI00340CEECD
MQPEVISALIGAAAAIPAAGLAYMVGRRQALATVEAARTQAEAGNKQWRNDNRRSTWLSFTRSIDELNKFAEREMRHGVGPDFTAHEALASIFEKLADVEFEGPASVVNLAQDVHRRLMRKITYGVLSSRFIATQRKFDLAVSEARRDLALSASNDTAEKILAAHEALNELASTVASSGCPPPSTHIGGLASTVFAPSIELVDEHHREAMANIAEGFARILGTAFTVAPHATLTAVSKLRECGHFSDEERGILIFNYSSEAALAMFKALNRSADADFRSARTAFLDEADKYLDRSLPFPRAADA